MPVVTLIAVAFAALALRMMSPLLRIFIAAVLLIASRS
jgi:hypothetical protein